MYQQFLFVSSQANSPCGSRHQAGCRLRTDTPPLASVQLWLLPCRWRRKCVSVCVCMFGGGVRRGTTLITGKTDRSLPGNGNILITNLMHWLLFIHKILFSSTCFESQVLIFRRIQLYTCSIWYCHSLREFVVACRYTAWVRTDCRGKVVGRAS